MIISSLTLDRYTATLGTLLVAAGGAGVMEHWLLLGGLIGALVGIIGATALLVASADLTIRMVTPGPLRRLRPGLEAMLSILRSPGVLLRGAVPAVLVSAGMTLCRIGMFISLYAAFGHAVPPGLAMFAIPMMLIALMVPVTIGGFGIREWLLVIGFEQAGVPADISVSVGILSFALQLLISLPAVAHVVRLRRRAGGREHLE